MLKRKKHSRITPKESDIGELYTLTDPGFVTYNNVFNITPIQIKALNELHNDNDHHCKLMLINIAFMQKNSSLKPIYWCTLMYKGTFVLTTFDNLMPANMTNLSCDLCNQQTKQSSVNFVNKNNQKTRNAKIREFFRTLIGK
jgi:hypothetical protein